jgi:hypothetical protein
MTNKELVGQIQSLLDSAAGEKSIHVFYPKATEFLRVYSSEDSIFYKSALRCDPRNSNNYASEFSVLTMLLRSFLDYVESGLLAGVSPQRQAELDVVSDFFEMANTLLETSGVHAAAPAVLIGATIEEFLRNWIESEDLSLENKKPGLETYSQVLREAKLITKQDGKDLTAWAGVRNHAAHGEWEEVSDKARIRLMLEGVNLFMRKYTP